MTDYSTLTPRELDALVAEKVMNLRVYWQSDGELATGESIEGGITGPWPLKHYSTSFLWMSDVLSKMRELGYTVNMQITPWGGNLVQILHCPDDGEHRFVPERGFDFGAFTAQADTLPRALAEAAVMAMEG